MRVHIFLKPHVVVAVFTARGWLSLRRVLLLIAFPVGELKRPSSANSQPQYVPPQSRLAGVLGSADLHLPAPCAGNLGALIKQNRVLVGEYS